MVLIVCSISPKTWLTALCIFLRFSIIAPLREERDFGEDEDNSAPSESDEEASQLFCK